MGKNDELPRPTAGGNDNFWARVKIAAPSARFWRWGRDALVAVVAQLSLPKNGL